MLFLEKEKRYIIDLFNKNFKMSQIRHCGFCSSVGHTIRSCIDPYGLACCNNLHLRCMYGIRTSAPINMQLFFSCILSDVPLNVIRLFACRLGIISSSVSKRSIIRFICQHYLDNYYESRNIHTNQNAPAPAPALPPQIRIPARIVMRHNAPPVPTGFTTPPATRPTHPPATRPAPANPFTNPSADSLAFRNIFTNRQTPVRQPPVCTMKVSTDFLDDFECPICYDCVNNEFIVDTKCSHSFCSTCMNKLYSSTPVYKIHMSCPMCRDDICEVFISNSLHIQGNLFTV